MLLKRIFVQPLLKLVGDCIQLNPIVWLENYIIRWKFGIQYTLANPNRGVSIKKKSVPISEFVRISEVIHLYGEFCSESL